MNPPPEAPAHHWPLRVLAAALVAMSVAVGAASALFLWSLDAVTLLRFREPWLLFLLPLLGLGVAWLYQRHGGRAGGGTALLFEEIARPGEGLPRRMAPMILLGTLATHLGGGSAGREGTALQIGAGIAACFDRWRAPSADDRRLLWTAGAAAGFGGIFGTPWAGAVFALEALARGRPRLRSALGCVAAAWLAHGVCQALGGSHVVYRADFPLAWPGWRWLAGLVLAALAFGLAARLFLLCLRGASELMARAIRRPLLRPLAGGCAVIALAAAAGTTDYLGLGVLGARPDSVTLPAMFHGGEIPATAWLWKLAFTVLTLAAGFKGGEVTPLFFIGAALGHSLAASFGLDPAQFAALGLAATFAAATRAPLSSTVLGIELFGLTAGPPLLACCLLATRVADRRGLYGASRAAGAQAP